MSDWYSVLLKYGVPVENTNQFNIHCPFHEDRRTSCAINLDKGVWICFAGCGQGNLKSFIWKLSGKSWDDISKELDDVELELDFSLSWLSDTVTPSGVTEENDCEEPPDLRDIPSEHWIYKRGFTPTVLNEWGCKVNKYDDLLIPVQDSNKKVLGWVARRLNAIPKYLFSKGFAKSHSLFGIHNFIKDLDTLYIVEGALDALWLNQNGYPTVAVLGASISKTQINLIGTLRPSEVVLSLDNDNAGRTGINKATVDMADKFLLSYLNLPTGYKDVQEIQDIKQLNKVIENRTLW